MHTASRTGRSPLIMQTKKGNKCMPRISSMDQSSFDCRHRLEIPFSLYYYKLVHVHFKHVSEIILSSYGQCVFLDAKRYLQYRKTEPLSRSENCSFSELSSRLLQ
ncbi:hypothetical protein ECG_01323 [Echinococcus granulosus]|nr:hypothetical protein ECG_01323 [Echinococcus granulosus]